MNLETGKILTLILFALLTFLPGNSFASTLEMVDQSIQHRNYQQAIKYLKPLLEQNSAEAQYRMAGLYRSGKGVRADLDKATDLFRKAAMSGLPQAQYNLASILEKRAPTRRDPAEVLMWYQEAADQGYAKAIRKLDYLEKAKKVLHTTHGRNDRIFDAIRMNDINLIRTMIAGGVNLDIVDENNRSTLLAALHAGHQEISMMMLRLSTKRNLADENGDLPIHIATRDSYEDIVSELIKYKVDINARDRLGNTALMIATRRDDRKMMELLLDNNANYHITNRKDQTAPKIAQTLELRQANAVFSKYGVKVTAPDKDYTRVDIDALQKTIGKSSSLYKGWPALNIASLLGDSAIVTQLLDEGANINAVDPAGYSAMHRAASKGQQDIIELLLSHGAKVNAVNRSNETPLYLAAESGHLQTVRVLLKAGASPSILGENKVSPLSIAIMNGHERTAGALQHGVLDQESTHNAMLLAMQNKMQSLSIQLIKHDKLLSSFDERNRSALWHSADLGLKNVTKALLGKISGAINAADKNGYTPLARAVLNGYVDTAKLLIDNGASIKSVTNEKNTILMLSVLSGNLAQTRFLLGKGIDIDARNIVGDTALIIAASNGSKPLVDALVKAGADTRIRNLDDQNAFDVATHSNHTEIATLIKKNSSAVFKLFN